MKPFGIGFKHYKIKPSKYVVESRKKQQFFSTNEFHTPQKLKKTFFIKSKIHKNASKTFFIFKFECFRI